MLALFFALREEIKPLFKDFQVETKMVVRPTTLFKGRWKKYPLCLVQTGIGKDKGVQAAQHACQHLSPTLVLSVGYAGGLQKGAKQGDLILPTEIYNELEKGQQTDPNTMKRIRELLRTGTIPFHEGKLLTVRRALTSTDEKGRAGKRGFLAVDMESHAEAEVFNWAGIPFASLRVIFDAVDTPLEFDSDKILPELMHQPAKILKIPTLWQAHRLCQARLYEVLSRIIPILSPTESGSHR